MFVVTCMQNMQFLSEIFQKPAGICEFIFIYLILSRNYCSIGLFVVFQFQFIINQQRHVQARRQKKRKFCGVGLNVGLTQTLRVGSTNLKSRISQTSALFLDFTWFTI